MSSTESQGGKAGEKPLAVATDLSPHADLAVERAARLARRLGAGLLLLHVFNDTLWAAVTGVFDVRSWRGEEPLLLARRRLSDQAADIGNRFGITVTTEIRRGRASAEIDEFVAARRPWLLVVGERGKSWVRDIVLLGGTALKVVESAQVPVLLVRQPACTDYSQVLVATDFTASSGHAARLAAAWFPDAHRTLLHAYAIEVENRMSLGRDPELDFEGLRQVELDRARCRMNAFAQAVGANGGAAFASQLIFDYPAAAVLGLASKLRADLIAIGRHGGSPLGERLLGSVTQNVLYYAYSDVLLAP